MSEYIAVSNNDFEIEVTPLVLGTPVIATPNHGVHGPLAPAFFGINDCGKTEDDNCKSNGDKFLVNNIHEISPGIIPTPPDPPSGGTAADFSCGTTIGETTWTIRGAYLIPASSIKTKCSSILVMRENDTTLINCACAGTNTATPTNAPFSGSCIIKISKAGQTKVKAE